MQQEKVAMNIDLILFSNLHNKTSQGGLSQPMNFRRMKFFKAVAVGFSGLSSLDGGDFPGNNFCQN